MIVSVDGVDWSLAISWTVSRVGTEPFRPLLTVRGKARSPLEACSSEAGSVDRLLDVFGRVDSGSGRRDVAHTGILDFSGLEALVDDSIVEGGLRTGGFPD